MYSCGVTFYHVEETSTSAFHSKQMSIAKVALSQVNNFLGSFDKRGAAIQGKHHTIKKETADPFVIPWSVNTHKVELTMIKADSQYCHHGGSYIHEREKEKRTMHRQNVHAASATPKLLDLTSSNAFIQT